MAANGLKGICHEKAKLNVHNGIDEKMTQYWLK